MLNRKKSNKIFIIILHFKDSSPSISLLSAEEYTLPMTVWMTTALALLFYKVSTLYLFLQPFYHIHAAFKTKQNNKLKTFDWRVQIYLILKHDSYFKYNSFEDSESTRNKHWCFGRNCRGENAQAVFCGLIENALSLGSGTCCT